MTFHGIEAERGEDAYLGGPERRSLWQDESSGADVFSGGPYVGAEGDGYLYAYFVHGGAGVSALNLVGFLERDYGVGAVGDGGAGHDADGGSGFDGVFGQFSGGDGAYHSERDGAVFGGGRYAAGLEGVAVHGGVVEGRDGVGGYGVFRQDLAEGVEYGAAFGFEDMEAFEDAFEGVLDGEHGFVVVMSVAVVLVHRWASPLPLPMVSCVVSVVGLLVVALVSEVLVDGLYGAVVADSEGYAAAFGFDDGHGYFPALVGGANAA